MEVSGKSIEYSDLNRELQSDMALYDAVLHRIKEVDVTKELSDSSVQLQEHAIGASPMGQGSFPIIPRNMLYGLLWGVVLSFILFNIDTSLKSIDQVENLTGLNVLAVIPEIDGGSISRGGFFPKNLYQELLEAAKFSVRIIGDKTLSLSSRYSRIRDVWSPSLAMIAHPSRGRGLPQDKGLVTKEDRDGIIAESFRSLRATVAMNIYAENQKVFLFTSALPSEGKSFCSANFSITLAQQGLKTLLIDADLRKPSLSRLFLGQNHKPGVSEVLLGKNSLLEAVHPSGVDGLTLLTAGGRSPNPAELLAGTRFRALVNEALTHYDRVVVDTAPLLAVSDVLLIAPVADVTCLVVRSFLTPGTIVSRAVKSLSDIHLIPTGIVLNCLPAEGRHYYSAKYYGSKGVYGS